MKKLRNAFKYINFEDVLLVVGILFGTVIFSWLIVIAMYAAYSGNWENIYK
jgi:hypothetical protein